MFYNELHNGPLYISWIYQTITLYQLYIPALQRMNKSSTINWCVDHVRQPYAPASKKLFLISLLIYSLYSHGVAFIISLPLPFFPLLKAILEHQIVRRIILVQTTWMHHQDGNFVMPNSSSTLVNFVELRQPLWRGRVWLRAIISLPRLVLVRTEYA